MNHDKANYYLFSDDDWILKHDPSWLEKAEKDILCPECRDFHQEVGAVSVVVGEHPGEISTRGVGNFLLAIISSKLLSCMGDHIASRDLYLGDVYDNQGNLLKEYRTYRGREFVHLHGGKGSTRRLCKTCGRIGIYPMTPNWLTHASVGDRMIYETNFGLLLSEEIAKRIAGFRPKNFYLTKIRWRDKPVEGDHVPMDQGPVPQGPG